VILQSMNFTKNVENIIRNKKLELTRGTKYWGFSAICKFCPC
jgi:hypothetical protein